MDNVSSPISTGGYGHHFEAKVQAAFITLMLAGGGCPCFNSGSIVKIKLQAGIRGYKTDDFIVYVEDFSAKIKKKLLCQVTRSIGLKKSDKKMYKTFQTAWDDYQNSELFNKNYDKIALITGPLNLVDTKCFSWILDQAKVTSDFKEFYHQISKAKFSPHDCERKFNVLREVLTEINEGRDLPEVELFNFFRNVYWLPFDLASASDNSFSLAFLLSNIYYFQPDDAYSVWARIVLFAHDFNGYAGTIDSSTIPEDLICKFSKDKKKKIFKFGDKKKYFIELENIDESRSHLIALANLIGRWNANLEGDRQIVKEITRVDHDEWIERLRGITNRDQSPVQVKFHRWRISDRIENLKTLGHRIIDADVEIFQDLCLKVLNETEPATPSPMGRKLMFFKTGNSLNYSHTLKLGIVEGLVIISNFRDHLPNVSSTLIDELGKRIISSLLHGADWIKIVNIDNLLPSVVEINPNFYLRTIESITYQGESPFISIFSKDSSNHVSFYQVNGFIESLEILAWEEKYLGRVCRVLANICSVNIHTLNENPPFKSLVAILLPWMPQTTANIERRLEVVRSLANRVDLKQVVWRLIIMLLPGYHQTSFGTRKPEWYKTIADDTVKRITGKEYYEQISEYFQLAVKLADKNLERITELIEFIDKVPGSCMDLLIEKLYYLNGLGFDDNEIFPIWNQLRIIIDRHERYPDEEYSMPAPKIKLLKEVLESLEPEDPIYKYQHLFDDNNLHYGIYRNKNEDNIKALIDACKNAIEAILKRHNFEGLIQFADQIHSKNALGSTIAGLNSSEVEEKLLPKYLMPEYSEYLGLIKGYCHSKIQIDGWDWVDNISMAEWPLDVMVQFFTILPFNHECWDRVGRELKDQEKLYWSSVKIVPGLVEDDLDYPIKKLLRYGNPAQALICLYYLISRSKTPKINHCIDALLQVGKNAYSSRFHDLEVFEVIKFLHSKLELTSEKLISVELAHLDVLVKSNLHEPKALNYKLSSDSSFFCEIIRACFRPDKSKRKDRNSKVKFAREYWLLLEDWNIVPGKNEDNEFIPEKFISWLRSVKDESSKSGHLDSALLQIGKVLYYSPPDPGGLWIHKTIAEELDQPTSDPMRSGYYSSSFNSLGVRAVDPSGKADLELAEMYEDRAEQLSIEGYDLFAETLRGLAEHYQGSAMRDIEFYGE